MQKNGLRPRIRLEIKPYVPPETCSAPKQLTIDQKMVGLKSQALNMRFGPQNKPPKRFIRGNQTNKWIEKHQFEELRLQKDDALRKNEEINRKNIEFAKDLFISWDDDGSGELEADEIIKPLINMGLVPDSKFAIGLIQALDPSAKFKRNTSDLKLTLQDFIKIFKNSKISEALYNLIEKESENRLKSNLQLLSV